MRRQFLLPELDIKFLDSTGYEWETLNDQGMQWVLITNFPIPNGYNINSSLLAIKIETGYPRTPLDMAYFFPKICRADGKPINALLDQNIDGKIFQRWSRHRLTDSWREGIDDLSTHISCVSNWLEVEFKKTPNGI